MSIAEKELIISANNVTIAENEQKIASQIKMAYDLEKSLSKDFTDYSYFFYNSNRGGGLVTEGEISLPLHTKNATNFEGMFYNNTGVTSIPWFDTSNGTNFKKMFYMCKSIKEIPPIDLSKATDVSYLCYSCTSLTNDGIRMLEFPNATNVGYMFTDTPITTIPLFDTHNLENFNYFLYSCKSLTTVPALDMSNATSTKYMFGYCEKLKYIPPLDLSNVVDGSYMFYGCTTQFINPTNNKIELLLTSTAKMENMSYMFYNSKIYIVKGLDFSSVSNQSNVSSMFSGCSSLKELEISGVIKVPLSFSNCSNLSKETAKNIINALVDYSTDTTNAYKYKITFASAVKTALNNEGATSPNGNTWLEYAYDKGWNT